MKWWIEHKTAPTFSALSLGQKKATKGKDKKWRHVIFLWKQQKNGKKIEIHFHGRSRKTGTVFPKVKESFKYTQKRRHFKISHKQLNPEKRLLRVKLHL